MVRMYRRTGMVGDLPERIQAKVHEGFGLLQPIKVKKKTPTSTNGLGRLVVWGVWCFGFR